MAVITVTQLNSHISELMDGDAGLKGVLVRGEIAQVKPFRAANGTMLFMTLKDDKSEISASIYSGAISRLKFYPEKGMEVVAAGSVSVYEKRGTYSLTIMDMMEAGAGAESTALDRLRAKLAKEGIFAQEHKRPLPYMPGRIGVVTSHTGAVLHDIIQTLTERYPMCEVYAVHCQVQGDSAPESIVRGIHRAEAAGCDVMIVGRGGGSDAELNVYNDERVARAIYDSKVPVVSAVGHEKNHTIADDAADCFASTPTKAAVMVSPDINEMKRNIEIYAARLKKAAEVRFERAEQSFRVAESRLAAQSPENRLKLAEERTSALEKRCDNAIKRYTERIEEQIARHIAVLEARSPLKIMESGYSLAYKGEALVKDSSELAEGEHITLRFHKGGAEAEIKKKW